MRYLIISLLLLSTIAHAQVKFELGGSGGVSAGRFKYPINPYGAKFIVGFMPGILAGININNKISVHTGFQHISKGENLIATQTNSSGAIIGSSKDKIRYRYLSVPLNLSYNFLKKDNKVVAGISALFDYSVLYAVKYDLPGQMVNGMPLSRTEYYTKERFNAFNRTCLSAGGGPFIGYNFTDKSACSFNPYFKTDLTDLYKGPLNNSPSTYYSVGATFNVLYRF